MQRASSRLLGSAVFGCRRAYAQWGSTLGLQLVGISGISAPSPMQLGKVVRLEELLKKSREEVVDIWLGYHDDEKSGRVGSVLTAQEYAAFMLRAKESPMFVLPLSKPAKAPGAFETLLVQCQMPYVLITGLEEFKRQGESAPPYVTLTHYPELQDSHGVVLVRGDIIHDKGVTRQEARTAMELTRAFYCSDDDYPLVHTFNHHPKQFDFGALLRKLTIGAAPDRG